MEQKYILGFVALTIVAILGISLVAARGIIGPRFGFNHNLNETNRTVMQQENQAMIDAIKNNDYSAWSNLMQAQIAKMQAQITQDNFNKLVTEYNNMAKGNFTHGIRPESNFTGNVTRQITGYMNGKNSRRYMPQKIK